ncbi:hypothetical protein C8R48DRAFT_679664 [Suillus tomentosus]|nr:hypothetical protein C8R48DRAFT_679664 [Suillus tomentosus]
MYFLSFGVSQGFLILRDGAMRATLPFERPLVAQCPVKDLLKRILLIGTGAHAVHATCQWLLLLGIVGIAVHATCQWLLLIGTGAQRSACHFACHLSVAPAYWDWGSAQCMPLVSGSCFLELAVAQCMPLPAPFYLVCSDFLFVTAKPAGTFVWQALSS